MTTDVRETQSRTHAMLKYLLRRMPCTIILVIEFAIFFILVFSIYRIFEHTGDRTQRLLTLLHENKILNEHWRPHRFEKCEYRSSHFNYSACYSEDGSAAYIYRDVGFEGGKGTCPPRKDIVSCGRFWNFTSDYERFTKFPQCAGLLGVKLQNKISSFTKILAPRINISTLVPGTVVRSKDLFVQCPVCMIVGSFTNKASGHELFCSRTLRTLEHGWPAIAYNCDDEELHENQSFCSLLDDVHIRLHGH